ncbi:MAG TPA: asparaginase [Crocinitomix sp.]|nr:asparaginase [Crocinitomix sp.]
MSQHSKILLIYTGGTIGMMNDPKTGRLKTFDFENLYKHIPELKQFKYSIDVDSIKNPIDSSEMNVSNWADIASTIFDNYNNYDGFVILHGTDTMAFTASALSFMLQGLKKPVIFTGSQLPIGKIRTDGKENLITAIEIAGLKNDKGEGLIQEVAIYFEYSLYRGNRASKVSANHFEAFDSPNFLPLAVAGVDIEFNYNNFFKTNKHKLELFTDFNTDIALLKLYPSMPISLIDDILNLQKYKAVIIEAFGSGNSFFNKSFYEKLNAFTSKNGIVIIITQCTKGLVKIGKYESSKLFIECDAINGKDCTTEAVITKTMYALGKFKRKNERIDFLSKSCVGEQTD